MTANLSRILRWNRHRHEDDPALIFEDRSWTYGALDDHVDAVAAGLGDLGVGRGDVIAILGMNTPEYLITTLAAARGGSLDAMVALLAEDCIRVADRSLVPPDTPTVVRGARAVAEETRLFVDRIRASTPMWLGGRMVHVIAPGGHPLAVIDIAVKGGRVVRIDIRRMTSPAVSR